MKKRSRKNLKVIPELDIDGLPFDPSDDSESGDETFLVASSREKHKTGQCKPYAIQGTSIRPLILELKSCSKHDLIILLNFIRNQIT